MVLTGLNKIQIGFIWSSIQASIVQNIWTYTIDMKKVFKNVNNQALKSSIFFKSLFIAG